MNTRTLILLCLLTISVPFLRAADQWDFSNPRPHGNNIVGMLVNGDTLWQAGDRGAIYSSRDLDRRFPQESGTTKSLRSIAVFRGRIFVSGSDGTIVRQTGPVDFSTTQLPTGSWLEGIAASSARIVAVGDAGAIFSSPDGENWEAQGGFTNDLKCVAYSLGRFVCAGTGGFIATSDNGSTWTRQNSGTTATIFAAAYIKDRFWFAGENGRVFSTSAFDSFTSANVGVTNTLYTITGSENELLVGGEGGIWTRAFPAGPWVSQCDESDADKAPFWQYFSSGWTGSSYILGGRAGLEVVGTRETPGGPIEWQTSPAVTRRWLWGITATTNFYAACGDEGAIVTSVDGDHWNRELTPENVSGEILLGIGGNNNCTVSVGTGGAILFSPNISATLQVTNGTQVVTTNVSLWGLDWRTAASPTTEILHGVGANANTFVVVGAKGIILASGNGSNWVKQISPTTDYLSSVTAWSGGFVASGDRGTLLTSPDGIQWNKRNSKTTSWLYNVRWTGGKLVAVGEGGVIVTSDNGVEWTPRQSGTTLWLNDVLWVNGTWNVAANNGFLLKSTDLANWSIQSLPTAKTLNGLAAMGGQLVVAGIDGVILRRFDPSTGGRVSIPSYAHTDEISLFLFNGPPDQRFYLEQKRRIEDPWSPATLIQVNSEGSLIYDFPDESSNFKIFRTRTK